VARCNAALVLLVCWAFAVGLVPAAAPPGPRPSDAEVAAWVEKLGSSEFDEREKAFERLARLADVRPALEKALKSPDLETRRRAQEVVAGINFRNRDRLVAKLLGQVDESGLDQFIDRMVLVKGHATEERWRVAASLARALTERGAKLGWKAPKGVRPDPLRFGVITQCAGVGVSRARVLVPGTDQWVTRIDESLVLSSRSIAGATGISRSILFIDGDMKGATSIQDSVIFCTGRIGPVTRIDNSMIVALGDLERFTRARNNLFDVKSFGRCTVSTNNLYLNLGGIRSTRSDGDRFLKTTEGPAGMLRLYDAARRGLHVSIQADGTARIDTVRANTPFARAGLRGGDHSLLLDGVKIDSLAALNRALRQKGPGERVTFRVMRGGKIVELKAQLED
jgi:hypothetical protein